MAPIPDESKDNPADNDPDHAESEDLETPNHIIPPGPETSSDEDGSDSDEDSPVSQGYMLLSQDPEEEVGGGDSLHPQPSPPPSALDGENLATDSMTEVRGAGIDLSEAVAQGKVHPAFAANFPGNKVPVHLQVMPCAFIFMAAVNFSSPLHSLIVQSSFFTLKTVLSLILLMNGRKEWFAGKCF